MTTAAVAPAATSAVLPFAALSRDSLAIAGGKGANLGELIRAGLPVPPGFCVTTEAYVRVAAGADLDPILAALAEVDPSDTARLDELAGQARERLLAAPLPEDLAAAITGAYQRLDGGAAVPVAVRSSATAEDLPTASFAGQQDTYLNVVGTDALLDAVRHCWASLWTGRAVAYRASNRIDHRAVQLSVVVQQMVQSAVAGVLFTANPLTGRRHQAVIDASPGLGEAVVSGAVTPDHFVVDLPAGRIVERHLGPKALKIVSLPGGGTERIDLPAASTAACLADDQVVTLARLGARVEAHYGAPQDIEWALDEQGTFWLVQARPITTLFPLPQDAPEDDSDLRVYFNFNVAQGVLRPNTPMGNQGFRLLGASFATIFGQPPVDPLAGPSFMKVAAGRLFFDITPIMRNATGRRVLARALAFGEARSVGLLAALDSDPRLPAAPSSRLQLWRTFRTVVIRTRLPLRLLYTLVDPAGARERIPPVVAKALAAGDVLAGDSAAQRLDAMESLVLHGAYHIPLALIGVFPAGLACFALAGALLGHRATADERQTVLRGLPHNPTTEMDLELWALAQRVRADEAAAAALRRQEPADLAAAYHAASLPVALQDGLTRFLASYGHRGVAEIDLGLPRWSDDPTHIIGALANYLQLDDPERAPDAQFRRGAAQADRMVAELGRRAGGLRGLLVRFFLTRARQLAGLRESPKFYIVAILAKARELLKPVGRELAASRLLDQPDDIFFVTLPEARAALAGQDLRQTVRERRADYERELRRHHLPRVLLSDGTEPGATAAAATAATAATADGVLRGSPASAGTVTARVRVILDPHGARLEPGEILVAPSTDPGWTPLFLTAGGLVMEMGGPISHGAVVAREYGIPAVVGVPGATETLKTGQTVTVDGSAGTITPATT